jgi:hypothetical protein
LRTPVCQFDLKSGVLCPKCEAKLRENIVSELDIKIMAALLDEEKKFIFLQKSEYIKSIELYGVIYIFIKFEEDVSQTQLSLLETRLEAKTKRKVRLFMDSDNFNEFVGSLISPARLVSITKIWLPDGTEELGLLIDSKSKMTITPDILTEIVRLLKGKNIRTRFVSR